MTNPNPPPAINLPKPEADELQPEFQSNTTAIWPHAHAAQVRFVLTRTSHPGNIGSTARALKTMGFTDLRLVNPLCFTSAEDRAHARALAARSEDLLDNAQLHNTLAEALAGTTLAFALTARPRDLFSAAQPLRDAAIAAACEMQPLMQPTAQPTAPPTSPVNIAFVFGNETNGLSNEELSLCGRIAYISANPHYSSLNLAQAVQLSAYEMAQALMSRTFPATSTSQLAESSEYSPPAKLEQIEHLVRHFERAAVQSGFLNPAEPKRLLQRLRRLFHRARIENTEVSVLRGMLTAWEKGMERP